MRASRSALLLLGAALALSGCGRKDYPEAPERAGTADRRAYELERDGDVPSGPPPRPAGQRADEAPAD